MYTYLRHLRLPVVYHCLALRHEEIHIFFVEEIHVEISNKIDEGWKYTCKYQIQVHYTIPRTVYVNFIREISIHTTM